jgi:hypothetical protein
MSNILDSIKKNTPKFKKKKLKKKQLKMKTFLRQNGPLE